MPRPGKASGHLVRVVVEAVSAPASRPRTLQPSLPGAQRPATFWPSSPHRPRLLCWRARRSQGVGQRCCCARAQGRSQYTHAVLAASFPINRWARQATALQRTVAHEAVMESVAAVRRPISEMMLAGGSRGLPDILPSAWSVDQRSSPARRRDRFVAAPGPATRHKAITRPARSERPARIVKMAVSHGGLMPVMAQARACASGVSEYHARKVKERPSIMKWPGLYRASGCAFFGDASRNPRQLGVDAHQQQVASASARRRQVVPLPSVDSAG